MATASFSRVSSDDGVGRTGLGSTQGDPLDISPELRETIQVLVIDDDRTLREGCASMLQMSRYNASFVGRGDEALELLKRRRFDIVLCDLYMSGVPGMTLLRTALTTDRDTLVIMMTGNPSVASSIEALRAGAWDYLPKPFSATHLDVLLGRAAHAVIVARETREMQRSMIADVSFISATNKNPEEGVRKGVLREDLFYRLRVVPIRLPALRERVDDIPILARHFLGHYWSRHRRRNEAIPVLRPETIEFLRTLTWRGNVRELQNVIEHVAVLAEPGQPLSPDDIMLSDDVSPVGAESAMPSGMLDGAYHLAKDRLVTYFEKEYLSRL